MEQYLQLVEHVLKYGRPKGDRTGTGTLSVFGYQNRYDLQEGFPLVTTKDMTGNFKRIVTELLWFLDGGTNIQPLVRQNNHIWDDWPFERYRNSDEYLGESMKEFASRIKDDDDFAAKWGDLGPVYGKQWRSWETPSGQTVDQITNVIDEIKTSPDSRRMLVVAYNPGDVPKQALPPCHAFFQFDVYDGRLNCQMYQRSADLFLGVPFNIASYALLTHMVAHVIGLQAGEFVHTFGNVHIYNNHIEQMKLQLSREPYPLPTIRLNEAVKDISSFRPEDIELIGYQHHARIKGEVAV